MKEIVLQESSPFPSAPELLSASALLIQDVEVTFSVISLASLSRQPTTPSHYLLQSTNEDGKLFLTYVLMYALSPPLER